MIMSQIKMKNAIVTINQSKVKKKQMMRKMKMMRKKKEMMMKMKTVSMTVRKTVKPWR